MNNSWMVDPTNDWTTKNTESLLEANVPGTEQCQETLTGIRCELKAGHACEHMVHMAQKEEPAAS